MPLSGRWAPLHRYRLATSAPGDAFGFRSRWRTVLGVETHDRAWSGAPRPGPPLVLVHGLAVSHRYLMPVAAELAAFHPVHVIDLPGDKRVIKRVEFKYTDLPGGGDAQVELWGKR